MASKVRSLLASRISTILSASTSLNIPASKLQSLLKINNRASKPSLLNGSNADARLAFTLPLHKLNQILSHQSTRDNELMNRSKLLTLASNIVENITTDESLVSASLDDTNARNSHLTLEVSASESIADVIKKTATRPNDFWLSSSLLSTIPHQNVVVEFSSPNIAKPFHVGHIRSTILGNWLAELHSALGHKVTRLNYLGDWGTQFGLLKYGCDKKGINRANLEDDPIRKLYNIYVWVNKEAEMDECVKEEAKKLFATMEAGDEKHLDDWKFFRDITIKDLMKTYDRLGIYFDEFHGESSYKAEKCMEFLNIMEYKGLITNHPDGRKIYEYGSNKKVTLLKSDGAGIYLTRDIAAAVDRHQRYSFDKHYYVVDTTQINHFRALFSSLSDIGYSWANKMLHVRFGRINGMSSRKGTTIFLSDILDDGREQMKLNQTIRDTTKVAGVEAEKAADTVALSALFVYDLKKGKHRDYTFNWKDALHYKGNTGVRLQYTHCRIKSLEENCGVTLDTEVDITSVLTNQTAFYLATVIAKFDEILFDSLHEIEPSILTSYLFNLCDSINIAHKELKVKDCPDKEVARARLLLFVAGRNTLAAGIRILGVRPLNRM